MFVKAGAIFASQNNVASGAVEARSQSNYDFLDRVSKS